MNNSKTYLGVQASPDNSLCFLVALCFSSRRCFSLAEASIYSKTFFVSYWKAKLNEILSSGCLTHRNRGRHKQHPHSTVTNITRLYISFYISFSISFFLYKLGEMATGIEICNCKRGCSFRDESIKVKGYQDKKQVHWK